MSVTKIVTDYVSQITAVQPGLIEGIYLTGSVALGDYYTNKSDIDFITVLKESVSNKILKRFKQIHHCIEKTYHYPRLNGYYLTLEGMKNNRQSFPSFFKNKMYLHRTFELDKITLWECKTASYPLYGVPFSSLPIDIKLEEVLKQLHQNINGYWVSWIRNHSPIHLKYILLLLFPRLSEWGILGVARQLYTIETGKIASKLQAGKYCLNKLPAHLKDIMLAAIATRQVNQTQLKPSLRRANETLQCMKFIIAEFNRVFREIA